MNIENMGFIDKDVDKVAQVIFSEFLYQYVLL